MLTQKLSFLPPKRESHERQEKKKIRSVLHVFFLWDKSQLRFWLQFHLPVTAAFLLLDFLGIIIAHNCHLP